MVREKRMGRKGMKIGEYEELEEKEKVDVWRYKKYVCKAKIIPVETGKNIVVLNEGEAKKHDIYTGYRTGIVYKSKKLAVIVDTSETYVGKNEIGIYEDVSKQLGVKDGDTVSIIHLDAPESIKYIKQKLDGRALDKKAMETIVSDITKGILGDIEISAWTTSMYIRGASDEEAIALTDAIIKSGRTLELNKRYILDKHCIGGVAGNRTTMLVVPIIASISNLYIPKTSSRAITSAAGTADTMEVLANVDLEFDEFRKTVLKAKGSIAWGGGKLKLASVDDKLIRIRHPLNLDPEGMLLASILAKKKSVNSKYLIIDIPIGRGAKIYDWTKAKMLAQRFIRIGNRMGMKTETVITDGAEPIGDGVGPVLECIDVLKVLEGNGPTDLKHKSCVLAGKLLELCGRAKGDGYEMALKAIESGKALKKMKEIIEMQGGNKKIKSSDLELGRFNIEYRSQRSGRIYHIDNKIIAKIARIAGAPIDKYAGVYVHKKRGDQVRKGDVLLTIYSNSESNLDAVEKTLEHLNPVEMRRILLGVMH